jgi:MEMO1 family protein
MESGISTKIIRPSAYAESFYPGSKTTLINTLKSYFDNTQELIESEVKALIVPHAGYVYSGQTAASGFIQLKQDSDISNNFVLIGPSHNYGFYGIVGNDFQYWETPLGKIKHQKPLGEKQINNELFIPEHSIEVELPLLQYLFSNLSINCFLTGTEVDLSKETRYFQQYYPESIYIISSDLSHYLPKNHAENIDNKTIQAIISGDFEYITSHDNIACGKIGISLIMNLAKINNWKCKMIYYDTSATSSGDINRVVGYTAIVFY